MLFVALCCLNTSYLIAIRSGSKVQILFDAFSEFCAIKGAKEDWLQIPSETIFYRNRFFRFQKTKLVQDTKLIEESSKCQTCGHCRHCSFAHRSVHIWGCGSSDFPKTPEAQIVQKISESTGHTMPHPPCRCIRTPPCQTCCRSKAHSERECSTNQPNPFIHSFTTRPPGTPNPNPDLLFWCDTGG